MNPQPDCIFCKIIAGEIPCFKLYEADASLAFMVINPANEGHALVIPKEHAADLHAVSNEAIAAITFSVNASALPRKSSLRFESRWRRRAPADAPSGDVRPERRNLRGVA